MAKKSVRNNSVFFHWVNLLQLCYKILSKIPSAIRTELIKKVVVAISVGRVCQLTIRHAHGQGGYYFI